MPRRLVPMTLCFLRRESTMKSNSSYSFQINEMARPEGIEPPTLCLEGRRSIQLSYGRPVDSKRFPALAAIICYALTLLCIAPGATGLFLFFRRKRGGLDLSLAV